MVPQWQLPDADAEQPSRGYEDINEVHVHGRTMQQLFVPTPESRPFTRVDAAKAFGPDTMLPIDDRLPHPELIQLQRDLRAGKSHEEATLEMEKGLRETEMRVASKEMAKRQRERDAVQTVDAGRFNLRVTDINVDHAGKDGKSRHGVGWRYGAPHRDRSAGEVKIPTRMD